MAASGRAEDNLNELARCVDCGQEIADGQIFRVLRRGRDGRRYVVCKACGDRRHAEVTPTPLQIQRTPPPPSALTGKRPHRTEDD